VSRVQDLIAVTARWRGQCRYPHAPGLDPRPGNGAKGHRGRPRARCSPVLLEGIGDTIRVSLTPEPAALSRQKCGWAGDGQSLGFKAICPVLNCLPGLRPALPAPGFFRNWPKHTRDLSSAGSMPNMEGAVYPGVAGMNVAVMGCIVNRAGDIQART